ncbi:hypothetical protein ACWCQ1_50675, partial [Streptomyces sp. NPDC002144]
MMVDKRHPSPGGQAGSAAVPLYGFQPPVGTPYGLEVSTVQDFFAQHDDWPWNPPRPGRARSRPLEWCIDGHSVISSLRLCGEFGGQDGVVG